MYYTARRPKGLTNHGLPWKAADVEQLRQLIGEGRTAPEIAKIMERSSIAIRSKAAGLGVPITPAKPRHALRGRQPGVRRGPTSSADGATP